MSGSVNGLDPAIGAAGRLRVLTWHVHGSYMGYLAHVPVDWYLPLKPGRPEGYGGRFAHWPENVHEVPAEEVRDLPLDCVVFQSRRNYFEDQWQILTAQQRALPRAYLEHDPPREHPTDTRHPVDDAGTLLVQVTHFNDLMWDSGRTPTRVIEHGVTVPPEARYSGELERGLVVVNDIRRRGRRLGADVFERLRERIPLDLVGMGSREAGGLGEIPHPDLARFAARYRFFFNPIRYTSLGLAVCEAMMVGMPIVALATTEMATVIEDGASGFAGTNIDALVTGMERLLVDPELARRLGEGARRTALERFGIERFSEEWLALLTELTGTRRPGASGRAATSTTGALAQGLAQGGEAAT